MKRRLAWVLLFALPSGPVRAQPAEPAAAAPAAAEAPPERKPDEEIVVEGEVPERQRRVCETRVATGSIMPRRVCRTVAQIEQERQRMERDMEDRRAVQDMEDYTHLLCQAQSCRP